MKLPLTLQACRRVMKFYESGAALVQNMGVPVSKMEDLIEAHCQIP